MASMNTKEKLENDMKDAMRNKDEARKRTLRMALSEIKLAEIDKREALDEAGVIAVIQKEVKSRREAIADAERASRPDLVTEANTEIAILETYLPQQLTPEELGALVQEAVDETGVVHGDLEPAIDIVAVGACPGIVGRGRAVAGGAVAFGVVDE